MLANRSYIRYEFTNTKMLVKKLARIEASSIYRQLVLFVANLFANLFTDCFCAVHTHQLEFVSKRFPTLFCRVKAAFAIKCSSSDKGVVCQYRTQPLSRGNSIPGRKTDCAHPWTVLQLRTTFLLVQWERHVRVRSPLLGACNSHNKPMQRHLFLFIATTHTDNTTLHDYLSYVTITTLHYTAKPTYRNCTYIAVILLN